MQKAGESTDEDGLEAPSYEEIVQILTFLVEVVDVKINDQDNRPLRDLHTWLQASLDAALRLEWDSRTSDDNGEVLYLD
jgi:hypothetical protein